MPAFREELELLAQHNQIHEGIERLEAFTGEVKESRRDFRFMDLQLLLDSFGKVLWSHLDDEVDQLRPENMKKFWTLDEVKLLPL